jgi:hypothetical protein
MKANIWTRPLIALIPALLRLLQCLRRYRDSGDILQLKNGGKYLTTFAVVPFSIVRSIYPDVFGWTILWLFAITFSTAYTYSWDIFIDWGLGKKEHSYLRSRLLYGKKV